MKTAGVGESLLGLRVHPPSARLPISNFSLLISNFCGILNAHSPRKNLMSWTGIASDLTLTDVIGQPIAAAPRARAAATAFVKPPPDVTVSEDMLPPQPHPVRRMAVILLSGAVLVAAALAWRDKPQAPAAAPSPVSQPAQATQKAAPPPPPPHSGKSKPPAKERAPNAHSGKPVRARQTEPAAHPDAGDTGDMSLEQFRQLSGKT